MQFDPKNPPRREKMYFLKFEGEPIEHVVREVQAGIVDEVLDQVSRIFDFKIEEDIGEQLRTSYSDYPKEFIEALSKLTGYEEQDIRQWGIALIVEITLDWINGNIEFVTESWNKKKGMLGKAEEPEKTTKKKPKKKQEVNPLPEPSKDNSDN